VQFFPLVIGFGVLWTTDRLLLTEWPNQYSRSVSRQLWMEISMTDRISV
jgi:hypothetical protein